MKLIKLDAIDSTNDYLKELAASQIVENFTIISAKNQTRGKGQMGSEWISEPGKNLTISVLIKDLLLNIEAIYSLNVAVAIGVMEALEFYKIPNLSIKWPNDILADAKKIGGILIENSIKSDGEIFSIVGIGINVNQTNFDKLPKASSLAVIKSVVIDKEKLLLKIVDCIRFNVVKVLNGHSEKLWEVYNTKLFRKGIPMPFQDRNNCQFMGIIQRVLKTGELEILLEDESLKTFGIKEIQMLY